MGELRLSRRNWPSGCYSHAMSPIDEMIFKLIEQAPPGKGQAPGRRVHESGLPFDDRSGDVLRGWMGVDRQTFYGHPALGVAAMAFCFPGTNPKGGDYPPPPLCAELWRPRLLEALPKVELT